MTTPPYDRALVLASLVRTMRDHYLHVRCKCGAARVIAIGRMVRDRRVADCTLAHVALRLSCEGCYTGPDEIHLTQSIFGVGPAPAGAVGLGWSICLVERSKEGLRHLRRTPATREP